MDLVVAGVDSLVEMKIHVILITFFTGYVFLIRSTRKTSATGALQKVSLF